MNQLKHVIFDLDHTLWDFESNSNYTLSLLFEKYDLSTLLNISFDTYTQAYHETTHGLWKQYDKKEVTKDELRQIRIPSVFKKFNFEDNKLAKKLESEYLSICPDQPRLFEGAIDLLEYLQPKYSLSILTNGFESIQHRKLKASGINKYFKEVSTSECSGFSKPNKEAFYYLLNNLNANISECIMIGDNPSSDIEGSHRLEMKSIHFSPKEIYSEKADYKVKSLTEIKGLI